MYLFCSLFNVYATHLLRMTLNLPFCYLMRTDVIFSQLLDTWNCQNSPCSFNYHPTRRIFSSNLPRRANSKQDTLFTAIKINWRSPVYFIGMGSSVFWIKRKTILLSHLSRNNTGSRRPQLQEFTHLHFPTFSSSILRGSLAHPLKWTNIIFLGVTIGIDTWVLSTVYSQNVN